MRYFRAIEPTRTAEDEVAAVRLMAVAIRGRAGSAPAPAAEMSNEAPAEAPLKTIVQ